MKTISQELTEAAAGRRSLGLADLSQGHPAAVPAGPGGPRALEFTFIYNDFFWALFLMKDGDKRPITSALNKLQGAVLHQLQPARRGRVHRRDPDDRRLPVLSKQFVRGLTLGSTKG